MLSGIFLIRPAIPRDAEAIAALARGLAAHEGDSCHFRAEDFAAACRAGVRWWVAEGEGDIIGFCMAYPGYDLASASQGTHLGDIFVVSRWRGQKVGRCLMAALARDTLESGGAWIAWSVMRSNRHACSFYASLGATTMKGVARMALGLQGLHALAAP